jgi:hypothetical protein
LDPFWPVETCRRRPRVLRHGRREAVYLEDVSDLPTGE